MAALRRSTFLLGLAASPLLAACATSTGASSTDAAGSSDAGGADAFPVTLEHVYGETEIPAAPARVVTIGWMTHDIVAALGVAPVGVSTSWGGDEDGFTPWFRSQVEETLGAELPTVLTEEDGPDYEQILSLAPDAILAPHSGITEVQYQRLTEIAPTVAFREGAWSSGTWQELTGIVATSLGRSDAGDTLIAQTEKALADETSRYPHLEGARFAYTTTLSASDGGTELALYVTGDPRVALLHELGMVDTPALAELSEGLDVDAFYTGVSLEQLDTVEADVVVAWSNSAEDTAYTLEHPLFSRWAPIAEGGYCIAEDATLGMATSGPSVLSIPWAIEKGYVSGIADAIDGTPTVRPAA
ncbi:ABC transporter substrate-binding protein [Brachybacterium sp. NBEC-018]|uniref:ABC transporter substrate-binding protein n=1 Tax=Brachybacterium sp. NBEC-018 TaxID=2996004 RepID=UPI0021751B4E|nr:ABC transporter substrate-binding protein [Brachybacterium sp. NBEC-018]UVY84111.1 ABC transporter substrate-binding protein [Brachybacterium sp. NBEC-018]